MAKRKSRVMYDAVPTKRTARQIADNLNARNRTCRATVRRVAKAVPTAVSRRWGVFVVRGCKTPTGRAV